MFVAPLWHNQGMDNNNTNTDDSRWKNEVTGEVTCLACVDGNSPDPIVLWRGEPVPCSDCGKPAN